MLVQPSFDEVQDEIVPGVYKVRVKKAEPKEWSGGTKYINWHLETYGESDSKNNGRMIFYSTNIEGKGAFMLQRFYRTAVGEPLTGQFDTDQLLGKEVQVEVVINDKGYTDVKSVRPVSV